MHNSIYYYYCVIRLTRIRHESTSHVIPRYQPQARYLHVYMLSCCICTSGFFIGVIFLYVTFIGNRRRRRLYTIPLICTAVAAAQQWCWPYIIPIFITIFIYLVLNIIIILKLIHMLFYHYMVLSISRDIPRAKVFRNSIRNVRNLLIYLSVLKYTRVPTEGDCRIKKDKINNRSSMDIENTVDFQRS